MTIEKRAPQKRGHLHEEPSRRSDFEAVFDHMRDNPGLYIAAVVFAIVGVVGGILYTAASDAARKEAATKYVEALLLEDHGERAEALATVAAQLRGDIAAEALYMAGEAAYRASDFESATRFFEQVRDEHPSSRFVAPALEGLAFILEDSGDAAAAITLYKQVRDNHPAAFEARRQWFNIGRASEKHDAVEEAIAAYNEQIMAFPGSVVAQQAQAALDRLRRENPALFPEDVFAQESPTPATADPAPLELMLDGLPAVEVTSPAADEVPAEEEAEIAPGDDATEADDAEPVHAEESEEPAAP